MARLCAETLPLNLPGQLLAILAELARRVLWGLGRIGLRWVRPIITTAVCSLGVAARLLPGVGRKPSGRLPAATSMACGAPAEGQNPWVLQRLLALSCGFGAI